MTKQPRPQGSRVQASLVVLGVVVVGLVALHFYNTWTRDLRGGAAVSTAPLPSSVADPVAPRLSRAGHLNVGSACLANTGQSVRAPGAVYRWKDANGVTHFSDTPPADEAAGELRRVDQTDVEPVSLSIETRETTLPPYARSRAIADAVAIGKIFSDTLGLRTDRKIALTAVIAGSDAAFRRVVPDPISPSGVYITAKRLIVVRASTDPERTMSVLRHEITHAIVHEWVGRLPSAMDEGLAEYFEEFESRGMGGVVTLDRLQRRFARIPAHKLKPDRLASLLSAPYDDFHGYDEDNNYVQSSASGAWGFG